MLTCKLPRCYKSKKNTCSSPNPWVVFNKTHHGFATKTDKDQAYAAFKQKFTPLLDDPMAYKTALCIYKKKERDQPPNLVAKFVAKLMKERQEIEMECKMSPSLVRFFEQFVPSTIVGATTLNPCQVIAKYILAKCIPRDQRKYYTFQDKISYGAHGLLLSGTFKKKPVAIKIIPVHDRTPYRFSTTVGNLRSVSEKNIAREFKLQKAIGDVDFKDFLVPAVHGSISIIPSKTNRNHRVAVLVMDKVVDAIDMEKMSFEDQTKYVAQIPCILHKLHKKGFIHGDLHLWNLMPTQDKPYVIDFGRSINVKDTTISKEDLIMLKVMDYIIPLEIMLRGVSNGDYKNIGNMMNMYLDGTTECPAKKEIDRLFSRNKNELFNIDARRVLMPIPKDKITLAALVERYNTINDLLYNYYFADATKSWAHVMDIN